MSIAEENFDKETVLSRLRALTAERTDTTSGWAEHTSNTGETYFYHAETQVSTWEKPLELQTPAEIVLLDIPWKEYKTPEGLTYFHSAVTNETKWDPPQIVIDVKAVIEEFTSSQAPKPATATVKVEELEEDTFVPTSTISEDGSENGEIPATSEAPSGGSPVSSPAPGKASAAGVSVKVEEVKEEPPFDVFSVSDINMIDKKDATEAFKKFLEEKNVASNINWENCVKAIQSDRRFDVWKKFSDRKQAFNQYKIQKQKQEKEDQRKRLERAREIFEKMISSSDRVSSSTPYKEAEKNFANDKTWRAVPERERESLYEDVMAGVEKREREQAEKDRVEAMDKLADILYNINEVTHKTTWYDCQKLLAEAGAFVNDPIVKKISKLDALTVFKDHILKLEKEHDEEVRTEKRHRKRLHRKNREGYQVLLDELGRQGILHSMAKWKTVFPVIRNDARFLNMQEQFGSNALDLFKLYVKDLQNRYNVDLEKVVTILKSQNFVVTSTTEFADFFRVLHKDDSVIHIDRGNIKLAYDSLRNGAIQEDKGRQEELRRELEREARHQKALEDNFFQMLKESKITFHPDTKWIAIQDKFTVKSAFQAIKTEEERIRLFHEYLDKASPPDERSGGKRKSKKSKHEKSPKKRHVTEDEEEEEFPKKAKRDKSPKKRRTEEDEEEVLRKPSKSEKSRKKVYEDEDYEENGDDRRNKQWQEKSSKKRNDEDRLEEDTDRRSKQKQEKSFKKRNTEEDMDEDVERRSKQREEKSSKRRNDAEEGITERKSTQKQESTSRKRDGDDVGEEETDRKSKQKQEKPSKKRSAEEDEDEDMVKKSRKKKKHHRSQTPDEEETGGERRKKDDGREDSKRRKEKERSFEEEAGVERKKDKESKSRSSGKKGDKVVGEKAEKLAKELSEAELEKQRKQLMKQLGLMD